MQIKQDKYNYTQSSKVKVLGKGSDVRLDMQLNLNNIETNIGSSITGTVVDSNNKPIQGAIIKLMDINLQPLSNAMTDINGNYIINSVPSSNMYNIIATAQGRLLSQASPFNLSIGQTKIIDFILQVDPNSNLGAISGSIYDVNSNNISGAIILLYKRNVLVKFNFQFNGNSFKEKNILLKHFCWIFYPNIKCFIFPILSSFPLKKFIKYEIL